MKIIFEGTEKELYNCFHDNINVFDGVEEETEKYPEEEFDPYSERIEVKIYDSVCCEDKLIKTKMWLDTHHIPYVVDDKRCSTLKIVTQLNWEEISKLHNAIYPDRDDKRAILL